MLYSNRCWSTAGSLFFLQSLPSAIENLFLQPGISINEEIATTTIEKINPASLQNCAFIFNDPISEEKLLELIRFLPLHQMERIQFTSKFLLLTPFLLQTKADKLSHNKKLLRLGIGNHLPKEVEISFNPIRHSLCPCHARISFV